ncbi:MAG: hypothetical protein ACREJI_09365 [Candidatus Methylomirabilales bacterium]
MARVSWHPTFVAVGIVGVILNTMRPAVAATLTVTDLGDSGAGGSTGVGLVEVYEVDGDN